ncbi:pilus protein PilZ [Geomonas silvestris]|uniref:Pilus protein PilZ n=1 Tax=Geomonas silvestris TaxID=2740184 RepID=A0A6V8MFV8_9BACT|nr:PilZ domain-containing protein [Geomonas silvestris]GFO58693.1 pilus protein PilZ [Geomonas silvestris]
MNDTYQKIELAGPEADQQEILSCLAEIRAGRLVNDLKLVNYYREIPVSYSADVLTVEETSVEFLVHQIQAVAISLEKVTVLKSDHFKRPVIATVNYVNIEKSRIVLSGFSYATIRADRRMSVRVALIELIRVTFRTEETSTSGHLLDISLTGVSIQVDQDPGIELSEQGELTVGLPAGSIAFPASLLKVVPMTSGTRLVFEVELDRASEVSISQFIFKRQVEIIKELKEHPGLNL